MKVSFKYVEYTSGELSYKYASLLLMSQNVHQLFKTLCIITFNICLSFLLFCWKWSITAKGQVINL